MTDNAGDKAYVYGTPEYDARIARYKQLETYFNNLGIDGRVDLLLRWMMPKWKQAKISEFEQEVLDHHDGDIYPTLENVRFTGETPFEETFDIMKEDGLLFINGANEIEPTSKGHRLFESGGWLANIQQTKEDRERERNNIKAAILTNRSIIITSVFTTAIIAFNAYTDKQALSISRKDHYLQHIMLKQQQSQHTQQDSILWYRQYLDSLVQSAKPDTLKLKHH